MVTDGRNFVFTSPSSLRICPDIKTWISAFLSLISLTNYFILFFVGLSFVMSLVPPWIIMASRFLRSTSLMRSLLCPLLCAQTVILVSSSYEIPLCAKPLIIESSMTKTFFHPLVTFLCFRGVFIPWGSLLIFFNYFNEWILFIILLQIIIRFLIIITFNMGIFT